MDILKGIRPLDYVLTAVFLAAAVLIGLENTNIGPDTDIAHPVDSTSAWMVPVFALSVLPVLWRRRNILAAIAVSTAVLAVSVLAFGWAVRCGFALPLSFAMAYAVARFVGNRQHQMLGLVGIAALQVAALVKDAATDGISAIAFAAPLALVFYGVGLIVQNRASRDAEQVAPAAARVPA